MFLTVKKQDPASQTIKGNTNSKLRNKHNFTALNDNKDDTLMHTNHKNNHNNKEGVIKPSQNMLVHANDASDRMNSEQRRLLDEEDMENAQKNFAGRHFVESPAAEYRDGYLKNSLYFN